MPTVHRLDVYLYWFFKHSSEKVNIQRQINPRYREEEGIDRGVEVAGRFKGTEASEGCPLDAEHTFVGTVCSKTNGCIRHSVTVPFAWRKMFTVPLAFLLLLILGSNLNISAVFWGNCHCTIQNREKEVSIKRPKPWVPGLVLPLIFFETWDLSLKLSRSAFFPYKMMAISLPSLSYRVIWEARQKILRCWAPLLNQGLSHSLCHLMLKNNRSH